ncbi:MAG: thermonuclease family protein [Candidatus Omnitrophota bacterium]|nr:thermonuclease family protein [Candidatus Omnitrophota bacterium]
MAVFVGLLGLLTHAGSSRVATTETVVRHVIDGDTIELTDGRLVRYLGIDTPEVRRRARPGDREWRAWVGDHWIVDPEPLAHTATEANRELVEGKAVRLEYDIQTHDRYGRTLAYVYVSAKGGSASGGGDIMVNEALLEAGYAQVMTIPPNVRYAERFRAAAKAARSARRGLWSGD